MILSKRQKKYFPLETNQELIKKIIPKISPKGNQKKKSILLLSNLQNPKKNDYKPFLNIILTKKRDTTRKSSISIKKKVFQRAIYFNINEKNSFLLPTLFKLIKKTLIENQLHGYPQKKGDEFNSVAKTSKKNAVDLAIIIVFLKKTDKSRKETLIYTKKLFKRFETVCHP
ncbi:hypothetical protein TRFO_40959 [Tritrichomonas foetus]|uniref:Ribosomal protein S7 domain-containing protein n=1 Tax=Tritrichomonas foetus TaxID=1144522 RepID=A0A1J4J6B9_9EUKA|nr:hypothetical protein TRFO_40959 [Tritrichomonas foetus]|eukprot:OHS92716.1 hypothetical protein TRFO_40959 [Tritrichomonas foetus]